MGENLCLSCGKPDLNSLKIFGTYLCAECESKLVKSNAGQADYRHWMDSCRKLWESVETKERETK
jgi:hypothetical protein